jgi:hypothetical protein
MLPICKLASLFNGAGVLIGYHQSGSFEPLTKATIRVTPVPNPGPHICLPYCSRGPNARHAFDTDQPGMAVIASSRIGYFSRSK